MTYEPEPLHACPCPLCGTTESVEVAKKVRFGYRQSTRCCRTCASVYQSPRRSAAALAAAYPEERAKDTGRAALPGEDGPVLPADANFNKTRWSRAETRALNTIQLSAAQPGDRVLELGCGDGLVLATAQELFDVEPYGVEPDAQLQGIVSGRDIPCDVQPLHELDPRSLSFDAKSFDRILLVRMLQRVPDPLELLVRCRQALAPGGRLVVETTNVLQPFGPLEANFFQRQDLTTFSLRTLVAMLGRAGFTIDETYEGRNIYVVARPDTTDAACLPHPFSEELLGPDPETCESLCACLATYEAMERIRTEIKQSGPDMDRLHALVHQLMRPAFVHHVVDSVLDLVDFFMGHETLGLACLVATAAAEGPYPPPLCAGLQRLASSIRLAANPGPPAEGLKEATEQEVLRAAGPVQTAIESIRSEFVLEGALGSFPHLATEQADKRPARA